MSRLVLRGIVAVAAVAIAVAPEMSASVAVAADPPDENPSILGHLDDDADEAVVEGEVGDAVLVSDAGEGAARGLITQVLWAPACEGNHPSGEATTMCPAATALCPKQPDGGVQVLMVRWTRWWDERTNQAVSAWAVAESICMNPETAQLPDVNLVVLRTFREQVKLLDAAIQIQPPSGRTLVNLDTIFYAEDPSTTVTGINILGRSVDLQITADAFHWHFGDGGTITTTTPGRPYPGKDVVHRYSATGSVAPRVDVTYTGEYRIDGGGWLDIPGDATVTGAEVPLTVVQARSELIAG